MLQSIRHEKFYSSGTFADELLGLSVGWAVHPRGFSDCMPIWNPTRTCVLFFHGEHHPDREQVARLAEFADMPIGGDARLVLRLYEQEGLRFLSRLNGCFQGVLADLRRQQVFLFNDRLGMQRLYYADVGSSFVLWSEAKALLKICGALRRLDSEALESFLPAAVRLRTGPCSRRFLRCLPARAGRSRSMVRQTSSMVRQNGLAISKPWSGNSSHRFQQRKSTRLCRN